MERYIFDKIFDDTKPVQNPEELFWLINNVEKIHPNTILEIGTENGGTFKFWEQLLSENGLLIGIDLVYNIKWNMQHYSKKIIFIQGDSTKDDTVVNVEKNLNGRQVDFMFIDGGHTEDVVTSDYNKYKKFVRKGGIIGFHDVNDLIGVKQLWDKLDLDKECANKESKTAKDNGIGIGILRV